MATCKDLSYTLSFATCSSAFLLRCVKQVLTWFVVLLMTTKFIFNSRRTEALLEMMGTKCKAVFATFHFRQVYFDFGGHAVAGALCLQGTTKGRAEVRRLISILTFSLEWMQLGFADVVCPTTSCPCRGGFSLLSNSSSFGGQLVAFLPEPSQRQTRRSKTA